MGIGLVVTRGYGNGTQSADLGLIVTRGYGVGAAVDVAPSGGWLTDPYEYETRRRRRIKEEREQQEARDAAVERAREQGEAEKATKRAKRKTLRLSGKKRPGQVLDDFEAESLISAVEEIDRKARARKAAIVLLLSG